MTKKEVSEKENTQVNYFKVILFKCTNKIAFTGKYLNFTFSHESSYVMFIHFQLLTHETITVYHYMH